MSEHMTADPLFIELRKIADASLQDENRRRKNRIEEAINWADLSCREVQRVETDSGDKFWRVCIEEASPSCPQLQVAVAEAIRKHYPGIQIEVETQW